MNIAIACLRAEDAVPGQLPEGVDQLLFGAHPNGVAYDLIVLLSPTRQLGDEYLDWAIELRTRLKQGGAMVVATPFQLAGDMFDAQGGPIDENYQEPTKGHGFFKS